jgi:hypothetical protein
MSLAKPSRHTRQTVALMTWARHLARPYAWSGEVPVVFVANPTDEAAAAAGRDERRTSRLAWNALPRV